MKIPDVVPFLCFAVLDWIKRHCFQHIGFYEGRGVGVGRYF